MIICSRLEFKFDVCLNNIEKYVFCLHEFLVCLSSFFFFFNEQLLLDNHYNRRDNRVPGRHIIRDVKEKRICMYTE